MIMEKLIWYFSNIDGYELIGVAWKPILIGLILYHSNYLLIAARTTWRRIWPHQCRPLSPGEAPDILIVLPTLLRKRSELEGLQRAIQSVMANNYPGQVVICPAIDHADLQPALCTELECWLNCEVSGGRVHATLVRCPERIGKAMAVDRAIGHVRALCSNGALSQFPAVFFNMDADSEVSLNALEMMVVQLTARGRLGRRRPMIVAANVRVRQQHYWQGWRHFFTVPGQLAVQVYWTSLNTTSIDNSNVVQRWL